MHNAYFHLSQVCSPELSYKYLLAVVFKNIHKLFRIFRHDMTYCNNCGTNVYRMHAMRLTWKVRPFSWQAHGWKLAWRAAYVKSDERTTNNDISTRRRENGRERLVVFSISYI